MAFRDALKKTEFPARLGDTRLGFDPPLFYGEQIPEPRAGKGTVILITSVVLAGTSAGIGLLGQYTFVEQMVAWVTLLASAWLLTWATWATEKSRRRRFQLNFETYSLRLDFPNGVRGLPKTWHVPFSSVKELSLRENRDGALNLMLTIEGAQPFLLISNIPDMERESVLRVENLLRNAFGLEKRDLAETMWEDSYQD